MSNQLLNKLKAIETSRANLQYILENKGVDTGHVRSLPALISNVSKLELPNYNTDPNFDGITKIDEPTNYYKGDDDWKDLIDIQSIIANDSTTGYSGKVFFLIRVSDNPEKAFNSNMLKGFSAYKFSDTQTVVTNIAHTWDETEDIIADNGERFRWVIAYTNTTTAVVYWQSVYFVPEAVIYYSGTYRAICIQDVYGAGASFYYTNNDWFSVGGSNTSGYRCPKYLEVKNAVTCNTVIGSTSYPDYNLRTCIFDGKCTFRFYGFSAANLEFFRYTGGGCSSYFQGPYKADNSDVRTYMRIANITGYITGIAYHVNADIYIERVSSYITNFQYNEMCDIKVENLGTNISDNTFSNCADCNIDIGDVLTIGGSAFYPSRNCYIKVGTIYGSIGGSAFRDCYHFNQDIVCVSKSSTEYSIGAAAFYNTKVQKIDLYQSRITTLAAYDSTTGTPNFSPQTTNGQYSYAFSGMQQLKQLRLSKYIRTLYGYGLAFLENLEELELGESLVQIGNYALSNLYNIKTIVIPDTVTTIGSYFLQNDVNLESVYIGAQVKALPTYAFQNLYNLKTVSIPDSLTELPSYCFAGCKSLKSIILPDEVTTIPDRGFEQCTALESVKTNGAITAINAYAFNSCEKLSEIFDFAAITRVAEYCFRNCPKLKLELPKNITGNLNASAFIYTDAEITLPANMTVINNFSVAGANWSFENILKFLYSLPNRVGQTAYTLTMGVPFDRANVYSTSYNTSIYSSISSRYVVETEEGLEWADEYTEGRKTIASYVSSKNWTLA